MDYIDTQGMSIPSTGNDVTVEYKPTHFKKLSAFTDMEREELKQMFREVLDEYCWEKVIKATNESTRMCLSWKSAEDTKEREKMA